jgi:hypothetical protein
MTQPQPPGGPPPVRFEESERVENQSIVVGLTRRKSSHVTQHEIHFDPSIAVSDRDFYTRTITDVIDHYLYTQLALYLNVSIDDLDCWLAGESRPPTDVFLRILELKAEAQSLSL